LVRDNTNQGYGVLLSSNKKTKSTHMKFDFTDQIKQKTDKELTDIYVNAKDYNPDFVKLAEEELQARNINLAGSTKQREKVEQAVTEELKQGRDGNPIYIFLCFVLALMGGLLGIYAGYVYSQSKINIANGESYYAYNKETRRLGKLMMMVGAGAIFVILLINY
jgi:hypothetical protein